MYPPLYGIVGTTTQLLLVSILIFRTLVRHNEIDTDEHQLTSVYDYWSYNSAQAGRGWKDKSITFRSGIAVESG